MKKRMGLIIAAVIVGSLLLIWGASLIRCEILTAKYYDDFADAHAQNTMLGDMEYFKVLRCDGKTAEVYYVGRDMSGGNVLTFEKQDGVWKQIKWETIWSGTGGSASDVIYPYWWHFIYGGL